MKHENEVSLDALLAGACILLNDAAALQKKLCVTPEKEVFRAIADSLLRCWDARSLIYNEYPQLKPEFMSISEQNPEIEEAFENTIEEAAKFEQNGYFVEAIAIYNQYLNGAPDSFYRRSIEFRVANLSSVP